MGVIRFFFFVFFPLLKKLILLGILKLVRTTKFWKDFQKKKKSDVCVLVKVLYLDDICTVYWQCVSFVPKKFQWKSLKISVQKFKFFFFFLKLQIRLLQNTHQQSSIMLLYKEVSFRPWNSFKYSWQFINYRLDFFFFVLVVFLGNFLLSITVKILFDWIAAVSCILGNMKSSVVHDHKFFFNFCFLQERSEYTETN